MTEVEDKYCRRRRQVIYKYTCEKEINKAPASRQYYYLSHMLLKLVMWCSVPHVGHSRLKSSTSKFKHVTNRNQARGIGGSSRFGFIPISCTFSTFFFFFLNSLFPSPTAPKLLISFLAYQKSATFIFFYYYIFNWSCFWLELLSFSRTCLFSRQYLFLLTFNLLIMAFIYSVVLDVLASRSIAALHANCLILTLDICSFFFLVLYLFILSPFLIIDCFTNSTSLQG